jgi:hypothetical protein
LSFNKKLPEWNNPGTEPPQSTKDSGWTAGAKPPADWFNWFFYLVYQALQELQQNGYTQAEITQAITAAVSMATATAQNNLVAHTSRTDNPHNTTKAQVGLGNADNTKDMDKPVSTAQAAAIADHTNNKNNPHNVTKDQVGLGNVDNTKDADKPVSTLQQTALNLKADKTIAQLFKLTDDNGYGVRTSDLNTITGTKVFEATNTTVNTPETGHYYNGIQLSSPQSTEEKSQLVVDKNSGKFWTRYSAVGVWKPWILSENATDSQAKADAAQTAAINFAKSFGLGNSATQLPSGTDLNNIDSTGFYRGSALVNCPPRIPNDNQAIWHYIIHIKHDNTWKSQIAVEYQTGTLFSRVLKDSGSGGQYSSWNQLETTIGSQSKADAAKNDAINWAKSFGLGSIAKRVADGSDANNLVLSGWYDGRGLVNDPDNTQGEWKKYFVLNSGDATNQFVTQLAFTMTANNNLMWTRQLTNVSGTPTWTPWKKIARTDDIDALKAITQNVKITADDGTYKYLYSNDATFVAGFKILPAGLHFVGIQDSGIGSVSGGANVIISISQSGSWGYAFFYDVTHNEADLYVRVLNGGAVSPNWVKVSNSASDILTKIKTVDGSGSGLDADLLGGKSSSLYPSIVASGLTYYVDLINGNDSNNGLSVSTAFKTLQKAISLIPTFLFSNVFIDVRGTDQTINVGLIQIDNKFGSGEVIINNSTNGNMPLKGILFCHGCQAKLNFQGIILVGDTSVTRPSSESDGDPTVAFFSRCGSIQFSNMGIDGSGKGNMHGICLMESYILVTNGYISHSNWAITADWGSRAVLFGLDGSDNTWAKVSKDGSQIIKTDSALSGDNNEFTSNGGTIV